MRLLNDEEIKKVVEWCYKLDDFESGDFMEMALRSVAQAQKDLSERETFEEIEVLLWNINQYLATIITSDDKWQARKKVMGE